ncbi:hypothetical protein M758_10G083100 [Ceratodon purpureus]|nr:hypothetical protein M758_10G083100 [Ceratodon purpureus]
MGEPNFLGRGIVGLLLLLQLFSHSVYSQPVKVISMQTYELYGLRLFWFAWNQSTPDPETNLAGWRTFDYRYYGNYGFTQNDDPCYGKQWRGLVCAQQRVNDTYYTAQIIGIVLQDVNIQGLFPQNAIVLNTFTSISLLILTGNPGLTGPVPDFQMAPIKILDLHGNGLTGTFPWQGLYLDLEYLDLSNNNFTGEFRPIGQTANNIRTLLLSHNNFNGTIDDTDLYYNNWLNPPSIDASPLTMVDFSYNQFSGKFCNLSKALYLNTLNISHNSLSGEISARMFNNSGMPLFRVLDLSYNKFNGSMPDLSTSSYALETLDFSWNDFTPARFPLWIKSLNRLKLLGLSGTNLEGEFNPSVLSNLTSLKTLILDNNTISGILDFGSISNNFGHPNRTLQLVSIRNNNITNVTYNGTIASLASSITFNLHGNPYCNNSSGGTDLQRCVCDGYCVDTKREVSIITTQKSIMKVIIISTTLSGVLMSLVICIATLFILKNRREKRELLLQVHERFAEFELKPTLFAFSELQKATRNFHADMKVGQGGYGAVYKGHLPDGSTVAVKQLLTPTQQTMDDFLNEVVLLTGAKHRNLVKLKGCCLRGNQRLLVYEYMEKYDLADVIFDHKGNQILHWPARSNICLGIAQGLHYLHAHVDPKIIHRDIKASNILLDKNATPKIADFGLAMLFPDEETHIMTVHVAGTKGYLAPEYATLGQVSEKVDVFSYGVLVLEVVSGRRNIDLSYPTGRAYLAEWAWNCCSEGTLLDLVDPTLVLLSDEEVQVQKVINIALLCIQTAAERRPTMAQVVAMLQGDMAVGSAEQQSSKKMHRSDDHLFDFGNLSSDMVSDSRETVSLVKESLSSSLEIKSHLSTR